MRKGSPPHTRGKLQGNFLLSSASRITPAYAGKTFTLVMPCSLRKDHPRIRGDNFIYSISHYPSQGSPPHTRGKPVKGVRVLRACRITPAYAGKTPNQKSQYPFSEDHPRIRGENSPLPVTQFKRVGSPPHTRGKLFIAIFVAVVLGITPAYAGKTMPYEIISSEE